MCVRDEDCSSVGIHAYDAAPTPLAGVAGQDQRLPERFSSIMASGEGSKNLVRLVEFGIQGAFFWI
jgi:hypothetical protein